jgi:hypothetical protein
MEYLNIFLKNVSKELEHKSVATDENLFAAKADVENCQMNLSLRKYIRLT